MSLSFNQWQPATIRWPSPSSHPLVGDELTIYRASPIPVANLGKYSGLWQTSNMFNMMESTHRPLASILETFQPHVEPHIWCTWIFHHWATFYPIVHQFIPQKHPYIYNYYSSKIIKIHRKSSKIIENHQKSSKIIENHRKSSEIIGNHETSSVPRCFSHDFVCDSRLGVRSEGWSVPGPQRIHGDLHCIGSWFTDDVEKSYGMNLKISTVIEL